MSTPDPGLPGPAGPPPSSGQGGRTGPDAFFDRLRSSGVVRPRRGRMAGGVCAGIAARTGIPPIVLRVAVLVLMSIGGAGLLVYLVALALLPDEDGGILAERALRRGDGGGIVLLIVIATLLAGEVSDRWWIWAGIPLALLTWWLVTGAAAGKGPLELRDEARRTARGWGSRAQEWTRPSAGPAASSTPTAPPAPTAPTAPPASPPLVTAPPFGTPAAGSEHRPDWAPPTPNAPSSWTDPTRPVPSGQSVHPAGSPWSHAGAEPPSTTPIPQDRPVGPTAPPHGMGPGRTWAPSAAALAVPVHTRRRRGGLPVLVSAAGLGLAAYGLVEALQPARVATDHPTALALAAAGAAAALVLLFAGLAGRRAGFTAFLTMLTIGSAGLYAALPAGVDLAPALGEVTWAPASTDQSSSYSLGMGTATLDLSRLAGQSGQSSQSNQSGAVQPRTITASVGLGELVLVVPDGLTVQVDANVGLGEILRVPPGAKNEAKNKGDSLGDGAGLHQSFTVGPASKPDLVVKASVGLGEIRVTESSTPTTQSTTGPTSSTGASGRASPDATAAPVPATPPIPSAPTTPTPGGTR